MSRVRSICLWAILTHFGTVVGCSTPRFFARDEGESVVFACKVNQTEQTPVGVYLKRSGLHHKDVLFKYTKDEMSVRDPDFKNRISISGDPSIHALNVTISGLQPSDSDRYHCEFNFHNLHSADTVQRGNTDFILFVSGVLDVDRDMIDTCVGGSVVLPCVPPVGDSAAVEGVVLKRQRWQQPMELLYHSKHSSWSSQFSVDRIQLSPAPGPEGITYSLTVEALQPEDKGLYSCQLLLQGRQLSPSIGRQGKYVSVQGDQCGCSSYSTLIYALSAAVAVMFVLLLAIVLMHRGKRKQAKTIHNPAPIYEEMSGLQAKSPKQYRSRKEDAQSEYAQSDYRNIELKTSCPENHYESPTRAHSPKLE